MVVVLVRKKSDTELRGLSRAREGKLKGRGMRNECSYVGFLVKRVDWFKVVSRGRVGWWVMQIGLRREGKHP